ncbi:MAG: hypothetical protein MUE37_11480, partial [Bacteroidales bacterium]|nr:hypothetical protein [Bacteroidales bacterium]
MILNHMRIKCYSERIIFLTAVILLGTSSLPPYGEWERRPPEAMGADTVLLNKAIRFAIENEIDYPKDLRIPILQAYGREPGFRIMGPVIDRGGPAGVIVKNGYIIASWGDIEKPDLTFSATKSYL